MAVGAEYSFPHFFPTTPSQYRQQGWVSGLGQIPLGCRWLCCSAVVLCVGPERHTHAKVPLLFSSSRAGLGRRLETLPRLLYRFQGGGREVLPRSLRTLRSVHPGSLTRGHDVQSDLARVNCAWNLKASYKHALSLFGLSKPQPPKPSLHASAPRPLPEDLTASPPNYMSNYLHRRRRRRPVKDSHSHGRSVVLSRAALLRV